MSADSRVQEAEAIPMESAPLDHSSEIEPAGLNPSTLGAWIARAVIVAVGGALAWYTWAHWGSFQIDNGREIYVPAALLQGKLLFRDVWYMYGPLAPYVQALLFLIFGIHLNVLYIFGLALTIGSALLAFEISRQFDLGLPASIVPSLLFLVEAFYPFIFNFVFPYAYAATLGSFLGLACLYFTIRHASGMRPGHLGLAALFASLALLTKQEFGFACGLLLVLEVAGSYWIRRSLKDLRRDLLVCLSGLLPALAGYGWFTWKLSWKLIYFDNWISTPGTYFMRTFGKRTMAGNGFRFVPSELIQTAGMAALTMLFWFGLAYINALAIKKRRSQPRIPVMVGLLDLLILVIIYLKDRGPVNLLYVFLSQSIFPKGIFFLGLYFLGQAIWKLWRNPGSSHVLPEAALGLYATLVSVRVMLGLTPSMFNYSVYFNVPVFLVFIILVTRLIRRASWNLEPRSRKLLLASLLAAQTALLYITLFPKPWLLRSPLTTEVGTFYTRTDVTIIFPQIISFMKSHTKNGRDILVLPEPPSLYTFAGMLAPTRWYSLLPGVVDPDHEQEFIREATANDVRYVLISNRVVPEYGVAPFGIGYNQQIYQWITANFRNIGRHGPLPNSQPGPYLINIYERKDIEPAQ